MHDLAFSATSRCRIYETKFQRRFNSNPHYSATTAVDLHTICGECYSAARVLRQHLEDTQTREEKRSSRGWSGVRAALVKVWSKNGMHEEVVHLQRIRCSIESETFRRITSHVTPDALKESAGLPWLEPEDRELIVALAGGRAPGPDATMTSAQIRAMCLVLSRSEGRGAPPPGRRPSVISTAPSSCFSSRRSSYSTKTSLSYGSYGDPMSPSSAHGCFVVESDTHQEARRRTEVSQQLRNQLVVDCPPSTPATTAMPRNRSSSALEDEGSSSDGETRSHHDTYEAILQEPEDSLRSWLEEPGDHRVYWIEGPRGSGKSTLMESISTYVVRGGVPAHRPSQTVSPSPAASSEGDGTKRIIVKFTPSSSSTPGRKGTPWATELARSMLYEILGQDPSLIPLVFLREWSDAYCQSLGYSSTTAATSTTVTSNWTFHQLKAACDWLFTQSAIPFRACLLIDSLDEFYEAAVADEGANHADIDEIVRYMIAGRWKNAQGCISTRTSAPMAAAFQGQPALRMADLTRPAMREYALDQFSSHEVDLDSGVLDQCVDDILDAADGVFLWAKLAISNVMRGTYAEEGFGLQEVRGRIRSLPRRLDDLYHYIIATKSRQCGQSRRLFRLVAAASRPQEDDWTVLSPLSLLELSFALEDEAAMLAVSTAPDFLTRQEMESRREEMASRLPELSSGLVKANGDSSADPATTVTFINDAVTAAFFASTREKYEAVTRTSTFNPNLALLSALVLSLKTERHEIPRGRDRLLSYYRRGDVDHALIYARRAEAELGYNGSLNRVVDALLEMAAASRPCWLQLNDAAADAISPDDNGAQSMSGGGNGGIVYTTKHSVAARCGLHQYLRHLLVQDTASAHNTHTPSRPGSHKELLHHQRRPSSSGFFITSSSSSQSSSSNSSYSPLTSSTTTSSYLQSRRRHELNKKKCGHLLALTLQPPAGLERFVSPDVVRTLLAFGADVTDAGTMLIEFLTEEDLTSSDGHDVNDTNDNDYDRHLLPWKALLIHVLPLQRRLYQSDLQTLESVFARRPGDWAEIRGAVHAAAVSIRGGGGRKLGFVVQKRVLWIFDQLAEA